MHPTTTLVLTCADMQLYAGLVQLRPKNDGKGLMTSAFQDEVRGLGFPMTAEELTEVNQYRATHGREPLSESPGTRHLDYGVNKEGYWNFDCIEKHVIDMLDCLHVLYVNINTVHRNGRCVRYGALRPRTSMIMLTCLCSVHTLRYSGCQIMLELDHSAGHGRYLTDGLRTGQLNSSWGGKQPKMRDGRGTLLTTDDVGDGEYIVGETDYRVYAGHVQSCQFEEGGVMPYNFYSSDGTFAEPPPKYDVSEVRAVEEKQKDGSTRRVRKLVVTTEGYIGKPKGMRQICKERGLYKSSMNKQALQDALNGCHDFKTEPSALQKRLLDDGHILLMSPKAHPELAGVGIEYMWGFCKMVYRRSNDCVSKHFRANVIASLTGWCYLYAIFFPLFFFR